MHRFFRRRKPKDDDSHTVELLAASALATIKDPSSSRPAKAPSLWYRRLYIGLRAFGLSVFVSWRRGPETRKIAIHSSRRTAAVRCLIHLLPVSVALSLLGLNFSHQFLSTAIAPQVPTALQFAAKFHEMTMTASMVTVLLTFLCCYLTDPAGLPLGAAFGHLQAPQLTYLFSPELLGTLRSPHYGWTFRVYIVLVLSLFPILMATVGPASAACMIPRYGSWLRGSEETYVDATMEDVFPSDLTASLYQRQPDTGGGPPSESDYMALQRTLRNFSSSQDGVGSGLWTTDSLPWAFRINWETLGIESAAYPEVVTSVQSSAIASLILNQLLVDDGTEKALEFLHGVLELTGTMHAVSRVQCCPLSNWVLFDPSQASEPAPVLNFSNALGQPQGFGRLSSANVARMRSSNVTHDDYSYSDLFFVEIPEIEGFGAVVAQPTGESANNSYPIILAPCVIQMAWIPAMFHLSIDGLSSWESSRHSEAARNCSPTLDWLNLIDPDHVNGTSAFTSLFNGDSQVYRNMSAVISTLLAVALSRTAQTHPSEWSDKPIPNGLSLYLHIYLQGYGWGTESLTIRVSLAILLIYCVVAIAHIIYSLWTGVSSTACDLISEAIALALNSPRPKEMINTDAGIRTAQFFEHRVQIAAIADREGEESGAGNGDNGIGKEEAGEMLALLFSSNVDMIVSNVRVNTEYGASKEGT